MKVALLSLLLGALSYVSAMDIVDVAIDNGSFNTLAAALGAADLVDTLKTGGPFTVLAPTDDAFAKLPVGFVEYLLEPEQKDTLTSILTYHVLDSAVPGSTVITLIGNSATTLNGEAIDISLTGYVLEINDATVIGADVIADNGIIHVINNVLVPPSLGPVPQDIYETAEGAGTFVTLLAAVDAAGLTDTLMNTPGPFTVLAPNDEAFAKLPEGTVEALLEDIPTLISILSYHVISGRVMAETFVTLDEATTLNGQTIDIMVDDMGSVLLNNSTKVIATDIMASNGVIHVIDSVLIPADEGVDPLPDIIDTAASAGVFNTLLAAVDAAGLTDVLKSDGPFTVLAPTDDAFAALPEGTVDALLADIPALTDILTYHVIEGSVMAETVVTLDQATALNGETISIMVDENGNVVLNDSVQVTATDIMASNGVIHIIDGVLIPPV